MEPSIVDYYNDTPHGVNVIDKMNEELADVQRKLEDYETPRVMYDNLLEWETLKTQGYNIIREGLNECIVNQPQTIPCITIISVHIYSYYMYSIIIDGSLQENSETWGTKSPQKRTS
jgi:hypothetical protein